MRTPRLRLRPAQALVLIAIALAYLAGSGQLGGLRERVEGLLQQAQQALPQASQTPKPATTASTPPSEVADASAISIYFAPDPPGNGQGPDDALLGLIASAQKTILCAFYDLELESVADALIAKHDAGVKVSVVSDTTYDKRDAVKKVIAARIPVVFDERKDFMHNKFCVVDGQTLWTGSTNITNNCMYRNDNNAVVLRSEQLAVNYTDEFNEMFVDKRFGPRSPSRTRYPVVKLGDTTVENYFAPEDGVQEKLIAQIHAARTEIVFLAYAFTSDPIALAMIEAMRQGVVVRGLLEARNVNDRACEDDRLRDAGAKVYVDTGTYNMHNKVIVIDDATVITGSYNFSRNADENNDENILFINDRTIAQRYVAYFDTLVGAP